VSSELWNPLLGVRIVIDQYVPDGTFYLLNDVTKDDLPATWGEMSGQERIEWLVAIGAIYEMRLNQREYEKWQELSLS